MPEAKKPTRFVLLHGILVDANSIDWSSIER